MGDPAEFRKQLKRYCFTKAFNMQGLLTYTVGLQKIFCIGSFALIPVVYSVENE